MLAFRETKLVDMNGWTRLRIVCTQLSIVIIGLGVLRSVRAMQGICVRVFGLSRVLCLVVSVLWCNRAYEAIDYILVIMF